MASNIQTSNNSGSREGDNFSIVIEREDDTAHQSAKPKSHKKNESERANEDNDYIRFWPFFKAIQEQNWKGVVDFVRKEHDADPAFLTSNFKFSTYHNETIFHIISRNLDIPVWVSMELASMVAAESLDLYDQDGQSPLVMAASSGNLEAVKVFVDKNTDLPNKRDKDGLLPVQKAAKWGHKQIIDYLWRKTTVTLLDQKDKKNEKDKHVVNMLEDLINSGHYDMAFKLLKDYPNLDGEEKKDRGSILEMLASRPSAFRSASLDQLGYWERQIYEWIPVQEEHIIPRHKSVPADEENQMDDKSNKVKKFTFFYSIKRQFPNAFGALFQKLRIMLWKPLKQVPCIKSLYEKKSTHMHTLEIIKTMCHYDVIWSYEEALKSLWKPLKLAIRLGICELVTEILKTNYYSYAFHNKGKTKHILQLAIQHRQEEVFCHIRKMNVVHRDWILESKRTERSKLRRKRAVLYSLADVERHVDARVKRTANLMQLAANYVPSNQVSGAALQMQRELQWFKAVESFVHPSFQEQRNEYFNRTAREVFTEQHKKLVEEGQKWMKDTATSCTVVAALIITVVFAAAFTVPGGNKPDGFPIFLHQPSFIVFIISDALALFSSAASVFMFLGILTSRYSEEDFLKSLPRKLMIGLITLFISIATMTTAFNAAIYIFLSDLRSAVSIPIALLGGLTTLLFAKLQLPLLYEMYKSTYKSKLYVPEG